jgi:peptide-methionine (S)-S-oxide reductase
MTSIPSTIVSAEPGMELATLGAGCFWCTEAVFLKLQGVTSVQSGFSGGHIASPSYKEVVTGTTGHAEVVHIQFDPTVISYGEILSVFFAIHDPTTLNRQGADVGPQYRSAIFFHSEAQQRVAVDIIKQMEGQRTFDDPIVTEVTPFSNFYPAEEYHTNYFELNGTQPYCQFVVRPKVEKFKKLFKERLK